MNIIKFEDLPISDDIKRAEEVTKESKNIKDKIDRYESLVNRLDDVEVLAELAEDDEETINEVISEIRDIEKLIFNFSFLIMNLKTKFL